MYQRFLFLSLASASASASRQITTIGLKGDELVWRTNGSGLLLVICNVAVLFLYLKRRYLHMFAVGHYFQM